MKKIIISLLLLVLSVSVFSQANTAPPKKTFGIHTEKRMFIKKGDRRHPKHHHPKKHNMGDKKHFMENHKKK
ncbi:MAG: hypothetical protein NT126_08915 [Bacteroidetes bacterium]|nr:hypothetical protein [Bacteroidota bacterium]